MRWSGLILAGQLRLGFKKAAGGELLYLKFDRTTGIFRYGAILAFRPCGLVVRDGTEVFT